MLARRAADIASGQTARVFVAAGAGAEPTRAEDGSVPDHFGTIEAVGDVRDLRSGPPFETKAYVCVDVFDHSKPVLYVTRPDGSWCALCGDDHPDDASEYRVVGLGHLVQHDPTLHDVLDLGPAEEAERVGTDAPWIRSSL